jgi:hypothetical protein
MNKNTKTIPIHLRIDPEVNGMRLAYPAKILQHIRIVATANKLEIKNPVVAISPLIDAFIHLFQNNPH